MRKISALLFLPALVAAAAAISITANWGGNGESGSFSENINVPYGTAYSKSWTIFPDRSVENLVWQSLPPDPATNSFLNNSTNLSHISARPGNTSPVFPLFPETGFLGAIC